MVYNRAFFMRRVKLLLAFLLLLIAAASCKSVAYLSRGIDINLQDAKQEALNAELKTDLNKKVTATSDMQDTKKGAIMHAYYKCIIGNDIDVVVDPIVQITRYSVFTSASVKGADNAKWWRPQFKAEIYGYGGKYVKFESETEQVQKFDGIDMNSVLKYKLITDPDFYKFYYNNQKSNNVFFNNTGSRMPASQSDVKSPLSQSTLKTLAPPLPAAPKINSFNYSEMYSKGKVTRDVGIAFTTIGVALLAPIGASLFCCMWNGWLAGTCCMGIGGGLTAIGIGCISGGCVKINKAKRNAVNLSFNFSPNNANLALNF